MSMTSSTTSSPVVTAQSCVTSSLPAGQRPPQQQSSVSLCRLQSPATAQQVRVVSATVVDGVQHRVRPTGVHFASSTTTTTSTAATVPITYQHVTFSSGSPGGAAGARPRLRMVGPAAAAAASSSSSHCVSPVKTITISTNQSSARLGHAASPRKVLSSDIARLSASPHRIIIRPSSSVATRFVRVVGGGVSSAPVEAGTVCGVPSTATAGGVAINSSAVHRPVTAGSAPAAIQHSPGGLKIAVAPRQQLSQRRILPACLMSASSSCLSASSSVSAAATLLDFGVGAVQHQAASMSAGVGSLSGLHADISQVSRVVSASSCDVAAARSTIKQSLSGARAAPHSEVASIRPRKPCNCNKSQCLKLYCDCFAAGEFCNNCNCTNCFNSLEHEEERQRAVRQCLDRNPQAFKPKIGKSDNETRKHQKGCHCKKSGCLKNYCECYEAKIFCSSQCKCVGCRNCDSSSRHLPSKSVSTVLDSHVTGLVSGSAVSFTSSSSSSAAVAGDCRMLTARDGSYSPDDDDEELGLAPGGGGSGSGVVSVQQHRDNTGTDNAICSSDNGGGHHLASSRGTSSNNTTSQAADTWSSSMSTTGGGGVASSRSSGGAPPSVRVTQSVIDAALMCLMAEACRDVEEEQEEDEDGGAAERRVLLEFGRCLSQIIDHGARKLSNISSTAEVG